MASRKYLHRKPGSVAPGSLFDIVERYRRRGLASPFAVRASGHVLCGGCRRENPAGLVRLLALDRPEHEVAPGERLAVAALQCTSCDARGTLPLTYGPCAAVEEDAVYHILERSAGTLPFHPSFA